MPEALPLRDYQRDAINALHAGWQAGGTRLAVVLPTGCHRAGQHILMHDGTTKAVEDIRVGDHLMGPDSTPRHVLELARGSGRMIEIRPTKGTPWTVNDEHILTLVETPAATIGAYPSERGGTIRDVVIRDWEGWSGNRKHRHKLFRVAVDFPIRAVPKLDPYFLGVVLGDGSLSVPCRLSIATPDPEIAHTCETTAAQYGLHIRIDGRNGIQHNITSGTKTGGRRGSNPIVKMLREMGLSPIACADRFVPDDYRLGSRDVRREILAGLIDTDGSLSRGGYEFASKSRHLADDVAFIARSLGLAAYVSTRANGHHRVSISGDCTIIPCRVSRKIAPQRAQKKNVLRTGFTAVPTGTVEPYYGFILSGDRRYLLDDFTVTHNSGKTVVFSHLAAEHHTHGNRTLVIAHRDELIQQAATKIRAVAPHLKIGIVKAERDEHHDADVIVASIQTLAVRKRREAITGISLVIVDEAHHAAAPTYMDVLKHFGSFDRTPTAGFTATMKREDGGLAEVWESVVYTRDILEMIADRHLVNVHGKAVTVDRLNLDDVKSRGGDFQDGQLGQALDDSGAAEVVADAYLEHAADRPGVVFTPTVATARSMADVMTAHGIRTEAVWGDMPRDQRASVLRAYEAGEVQVLSNCMVLTEGFDAPWASCAVIARPTRSAALYVQMVGRVLRPWKDKKDALVLDIMGASTRHKLASLIDLTARDLSPLDDDQSLAAALADDPDALPGLRGVAVDWQDIDLFHNSAVRWLQTRGKTWFIPAGDDLFFLVPSDEPQAYRIRRWSPDQGIRVPNPDPEYPLEFAMRWAEIYAQRHAPQLASKAASWRAGSPTPKQLAFCRFNRIAVPRGSTAGDVSDLQAIFQASSRIDGRTKVAA